MRDRDERQYAIPAEKRAVKGQTRNNPSLGETDRISVLRHQHLVPLLASPNNKYAGNQPWRGILLEQHSVVPGEIPEHEHPDLCIHLQMTGNGDFEWWSKGKRAVEHTSPG